MECATGSFDFVIGLGANLGDPAAQLVASVGKMQALGQITALSALYETSAVGPAQPDFLNAALRLTTALGPPGLWRKLRSIEVALGRVRRERWGPRTIDLDVLWMAGGTFSDHELEIPHPRLTERLFALLPLLDVAPEAAAPPGTSYAEIAAQLKSQRPQVRLLAGTEGGVWARSSRA